MPANDTAAAASDRPALPAARRREPLVLFQWAVSSYFGWGLYGLNLLLAWADRTDLLPASLLPVDPAALDLDPLERHRLAPALQRSAELQAELKRAAGRAATTSRLVLQPVLNGMEPVRVAHDVVLDGSPTVGVAFLETVGFSAPAAARLRRYPLVVAGSRWNRDLLLAAGAPSVALLLQGIDPSQFHPAPRRGLFPGRFVVFSGGKLEYRKGQDLVLRGFRRFARRHPEALLVTAWGSPWPQLARMMPPDPRLPPPPLDAAGRPDVAAWTRAAGLPDAQVLHCGAVPNRMMPRILREADVALFTNRAEGGTNLIAMEAMACGVPTILSANTGHLDLLDEGAAVPLQRQAAIRRLPDGSAACSFWGESDEEEIAAALQTVYDTPAAARARAATGVAGRAAMSWSAQMQQLATLLPPLLPNMP